MTFDDRTVFVTGAAGNLGEAVANAFAMRGANLVLVDRDQARLERVYGAETPQRLHVSADLLDQAQVERAVASAVVRFGGIDVVCNLAGGFRMGKPVHETSDADWTLLFDVNVRTLLNVVRAVVPRLIARGGGKIVNVGAASAQKGAASMGPYCASKASVIRLTESMAAELRDRNINVNCVLPTIVDTPQNRSAMPDADTARWVQPMDLAATIVYLASDEARAIHGAALPVSGLG